MNDNLEHGWIVDGIPACMDKSEPEFHCVQCRRLIIEGGVSVGFGKYICDECNNEEDDD